jgi:hypothetical protein
LQVAEFSVSTVGNIGLVIAYCNVYGTYLIREVGSMQKHKKHPDDLGKSTAIIVFV